MFQFFVDFYNHTLTWETNDQIAFWGLVMYFLPTVVIYYLYQESHDSFQATKFMLKLMFVNVLVDKIEQSLSFIKNRLVLLKICYHLKVASLYKITMW